MKSSKSMHTAMPFRQKPEGEACLSGIPLAMAT